MTISELYRSKEYCTGCAACYSVCPVDAISMVQDEEGFLYPVIKEDKCINCNRCIDVCQIYKKPRDEHVVSSVLLAVKNSNLETRMKSSSGGVFSLFAENILSNGGYVFGVIINDECKVVHSVANTTENYLKMRGSKYVQSEMGNIYKQCKKNLKKINWFFFPAHRVK